MICVTIDMCDHRGRILPRHTRLVFQEVLRDSLPSHLRMVARDVPFQDGQALRLGGQADLRRRVLQIMAMDK